MRYLLFIYSIAGISFLTAYTTNPTISLGVQPINELSVQALGTPLTISHIHSKPSAISKGTYAITTNGNAKKIIGSLDIPLPSNTTLSVALQAPLRAYSHGAVLLSKENSILVSEITRVAQDNLIVTYTFSSNKPALAGTYLKTVRFTLID